MWAFLPKKLPKPPPTFEELAARATVQVAISRTGCFVRNQMRSRLACFLASGRWRPAERAVLLYFSLPAAISNVILLRGYHDEGVYWSARDCIDDERTDLGWRVGERARRRFRLALREWELLHLLRAFLVWLGHFGAASRDFAEEAEEHSRGPPDFARGFAWQARLSNCLSQGRSRELVPAGRVRAGPNLAPHSPAAEGRRGFARFSDVTRRTGPVGEGNR